MEPIEIMERKVGFLRLPPELRNRIYEYALLCPDFITVAAGLKPPGLLQTCRQTRAEATDIWYQRNKFSIIVTSCDATLLRAFKSFARAHSTISVPTCLHLRGVGNWSNLKHWCEDIFYRKTCILTRGAAVSGEGRVIAAAHDIALRHGARAKISGDRDGEWMECEGSLEALRFAVGTFEPAWLN